jgi:hypothetical protein
VGREHPGERAAALGDLQPPADDKLASESASATVAPEALMEAAE